MRQVEHDLDLRLVVERQQLHPHVLGGEQRAGGDGRRADDEKEDLRPPAPFQQRPGDGDIEAAHRADPVMSAAVVAAALRPAKRSKSHGVTVTATKNENSIAIEAFAGIGLM